MVHIYYVENRFRLPVPLFVESRVNNFQQEILKKFGLDFKVRINKITGVYEVFLLGWNYPCGDDWMPQFNFRISRKKRGVILKALRFPAELRGMGLGTYCVDWLKSFCKASHIKYIGLGFVDSAEGFWEKMGFTLISDHEDREVYYF